MRILIVDDRSLGIRVLREPIEEAEPSYRIEGATTAGEARDLVEKSKNTPFDVFLIDQNLGLGPDGIELMGELRQLSPRSDAMIFTADDYPNTKQRAIEAGACDYFTKPLDHQRLLSQLRRLLQERSTRDERNWLQTLTEIAEEMQGATTEKTVADVIVRGALRFGFLRARLRLFAQAGKETADDPEVIGVSQAGIPKLEGFEGLRMPLSKLLYSQKAIAAGQPLFFLGRELGPGGADEFFASLGIHPPIGEWVKVPILSGENRIGSLTLDNADQSQIFHPKQREQLTLLLALFGKQAAAALERARLHERANHQAQKAQILSDIGRSVTTRAAQGSLEDLLETIREQLGKELGLDNELRIHVARRGEQVTVLSRHTTDDGSGWVEAKAAT